MNNRLINTKVAGGGGCTDIVDNYDPFGDSSGLALYQLNGNATDVSTNYNGNFIDPDYGTGVFGQAGVFNGTSSNVSCVDLPDSLAEAIGVNDFTFSLWINPTAFTYNGNGTIPISFVKPLTAYLQFNSNGNISFYRLGSSGYGITSNISLTTNSWYHIVAQQSSTDGGRLYINGNLVGQDSDNGNLIAGGNYQSIIGGYVNFTYANFWFQGSIDQTRIFNRTLTSLEVEALYTEELCICDGTVDTLDILGDGSCIATYQLDGNANDLSGNYSGQATDVSYGVGEFDLAGVFNGSTSRINIISPISNSTDTTDFSVSIWVKPTNVFTSNFEGVIGQAGGYDQYPFGLIIRYISANSYRIEFSRGYNNVFYQYLYTHTTPINFNNWQLITATYNSSIKEYKVYLNSQLLETTSTKTTFTPYSIDPNISLGQYNANGVFNAYAFEGSIDQVRIFNKALNSTEVTTLYNETACTKAACTGTTNTLDILGDGSCIATYPLDGSPADLSGNYNGIQTDVTYPVGEFDLAAAFNGSSSKVVLGALNQFSSNTVSFSLWFNSPSVSTTAILIGSNQNSIFAGELDLYIYNSGFLLQVATASNAYKQWTTPANLSNNTWHNVVVTLDSNTSEVAKIYLDGNEQTKSILGQSGTISGALLNSASNLNLGVDNVSSFYFNGSIDQVRIFNKVLNQTEVDILFNDETPCS